MDSITSQKLEALHYQKMEAERKLEFWNLRYHAAERSYRMHPYSERRGNYFDLVKDRIHVWSSRLEYIKRQLGGE
jgi:hypothetical protein